MRVTVCDESDIGEEAYRSVNSSSHGSEELAACILLAGSLKPSPLAVEADRSVLDLHLSPEGTVLEYWSRCFMTMGQAIGHMPPVRVIYGTNGHAPAAPRDTPGLSLELDQQPFRGPAGAVKDACKRYKPGSLVIVAEAGRYLACDLAPMVREHVERRSDITVASDEDAVPAGVFLLRCETLDLVPAMGFTDLKEQWLGRAVSAGKAVRVFRFRRGSSFELRTREDFLTAAKAAGGLCSTIQGGFAGVEGQALGGGASIGQDAVIIDSVVMPGATVGRGAVVVRSLVCASGVVAPGATVVDSVVGSPPKGVRRPGRQQEHVG
jgi:hypothetical protein